MSKRRRNNHKLDATISHLPPLLESTPAKKPKKRALYQSSAKMSALVHDLQRFHFGVDFSLFMVGTIYVILVPYTNAEESFPMQATHDMLFHGYIDIQNYDHNQFASTAAPQSFVAPLLLSLMVAPFKFLLRHIYPLIFSSLNLKMHCQHLIRISLLSINIMSLSYFRKSFIDVYIAPQYMKAHKNKEIVSAIELIKAISNLFAILVAAQFHYLFYQSRLLSNSFALPLVTFAFAFYFQKKYHLALQCLVASTILFRCHTILIALPFAAVMLFRAHQESKFESMLLQFGLHGAKAAFVCISLSFAVDTWFWNGYHSFPQFEALFYAQPHTSSASSWHAYFTTHLARMLLVNIAFIPCAMFKIHPLLCTHAWHRIKIKHKTKHKKAQFWILCCECLDLKSIQLALIGVIFVLLSSFIPHKETRFIYFVIPPFTLLSTIGCIRLLTLWGFRDVDSAQFTLEYHRKHVQKKHAQTYYLRISEFMDKTKEKKANKVCSVSFILTIAIVISICVSLLIAVLSVVGKSYTYCGGKAMEKFELLTRSDITRSCYNYNNILNDRMHIKGYDVNCVYIATAATDCGATRFTIPTYCGEFRFDKRERDWRKDEYATQIDPCHLRDCDCDEICTNEDCDNECDDHKRGYDYLITELDEVPNYEVIRGGIVYAKAKEFSIFNRSQPFLKPSLYIHKKIDIQRDKLLP